MKGKEYPDTFAEREKMFKSDSDCYDYLKKLRWPKGFVCPKCGSSESWSMGNDRVLCAKCRWQQSVLSGTVMQREKVNDQDAEVADCALSKCHLVISLFKRWMTGTLQGNIGQDHLDDYLNEFVFRFNRRTSRSRGLLFQRLAGLAMATEPNPRSSIIGGNAQDVV